jgi:hypothetical protein
MHSWSTPTLYDMSRGHGPPVIGSTAPAIPTQGTLAAATSQLVRNSGAMVSARQARKVLRSAAILVIIVEAL